MNKKEIEQYIRQDLGSVPKHDCEALANASKQTAMEIESTPWDVLQLVLENKPISDFYTHSYGFQNRQGREIIKLFESNYHSYAKQ